MRITIVGTGYVGLVTGTCFAASGNEVTCLDVDRKKIDLLRAGQSPIYEPGLVEMMQRNTRARRLFFTTDRAAAYQGAEAIFICVGTPSDEQGRADLKYVLAAASEIGESIDALPGSEYDPSPEKRPIVVVKSTVPVGTNALVAAAIAERTDRSFAMASNPEFLKEGAAISDFMKPDRVIIGADDKVTGERLREMYEPFVRQGNPIFIMDIPSAEMAKYASNAMLATKISFINEIARLCEAYGADIDAVRRGMCSDVRIGNKFLYPGLGYGGSCFPKDVLACIAMGAARGKHADLLSAVHEVNQRQRLDFFEKIVTHFGAGGLAGKTLAVWGIAFKPGTDDVREAPSLTIIQALLDAGASVRAYDSVAAEAARRTLGNAVVYAEDPYAALEGADALVVCTDWDEFKHPDYDALREKLSSPVIFDGRNLYHPRTMREHGLTYYSVGRLPVTP